jgi:four helix bundle protein
MRNDRENLSERLLDFGARVIRLAEKINRTTTGRHIANQVVRSATSSGANYQEACAAESRADFIHKMQVVLKELRETLYWLRLIEKLGSNLATGLGPLLKEADELVSNFTKSIITAKSRPK